MAGAVIGEQLGTQPLFLIIGLHFASLEFFFGGIIISRGIFVRCLEIASHYTLTLLFLFSGRLAWQFFRHKFTFRDCFIYFAILIAFLLNFLVSTAERRAKRGPT